MLLSRLTQGNAITIINQVSFTARAIDQNDGVRVYECLQLILITTETPQLLYGDMELTPMEPARGD